MSLRDEIQRLAHEFEQQDNAAHDLWTWCPSYASAKHYWQRRALRCRPCIADLMREVALLLANASGYSHTAAEIVEWFCADTADLDIFVSNEEKLEFVRGWFADKGWPLLVKDDTA